MPRGFSYVGEITNRETFASGVGVRDRQRLKATYGDGSWRKRKGEAKVERRGQIFDAEIHWYEAHGIGRVEDKIVRVIR